MIEDEPGWIYAQREREMLIIEQDKARYEIHDKKEELWARSRKFVALAPWVVAAAVVATQNFEGYDEKMITNGAAGYLSLVGFILADLRMAKQTNEAYITAKMASGISDQLGLARARWMEEGLKKCDHDRQDLDSRAKRTIPE